MVVLGIVLAHGGEIFQNLFLKGLRGGADVAYGPQFNSSQTRVSRVEGRGNGVQPLDLHLTRFFGVQGLAQPPAPTLWVYPVTWVIFAI
jgi:hypothetical protein